MMMTEGMDKVLIEEVVFLLMGDMVVEDPRVHIVEAGVALIMVMDQIQLPDQNQEEAPSMNELKARKMGDMIGLIQFSCGFFFFFKSSVIHISDNLTVHAAGLHHPEIGRDPEE